MASGVALPAVAEQPKVPEEVAEYFATGLVPRLLDLYGAAKVGPKSEVGSISRVSVWTDEYLSGGATKSPSRLTNEWIAPVSDAEKPIGLATVWINPATDRPELAEFDLNPGLVAALAAAPKESVLVYDEGHGAWFSLVETVLTPIVPGTSGITAATTPDAAQATLAAESRPPARSPSMSQGLIVAGVTLGIVVPLLAVFVLLPGRRRTTDQEEVLPAEGESSPDGDGLHESVRVP